MNHLIRDTRATVLDGTTATFMDVRGWLYFSFQVTATAAVAEGAAAQFEVQYAPPSDADPCAPGTFAAIPEVVTCSSGVAGEKSIFVVEGPVAIGQVCTFTVPCNVNGFVTVVAPPARLDANYPTGAEGSFDIIGLQKGPA